MKKIRIIAVIMTLTLVLSLAGCGKPDLEQLEKEAESCVTQVKGSVAMGEEIVDFKSLFTTSEGALITIGDTKGVDLNKPGEYDIPLTVTYKEYDFEQSYKLKVIDSVPPEIKVDAVRMTNDGDSLSFYDNDAETLMVFKGMSYDPAEFLNITVTDNSSENIKPTFVSFPATDTTGTYKGSVKAVDSSGNEAQKEVNVMVREMYSVDDVEAYLFYWLFIKNKDKYSGARFNSVKEFTSEMMIEVYGDNTITTVKLPSNGVIETDQKDKVEMIPALYITDGEVMNLTKAKFTTDSTPAVIIDYTPKKDYYRVYVSSGMLKSDAGSTELISSDKIDDALNFSLDFKTILEGKNPSLTVNFSCYTDRDTSDTEDVSITFNLSEDDVKSFKKAYELNNELQNVFPAHLGFVG